MPDQLRTGVSKPDRYEPDINATYFEMATHYGTAVVPARPRKPKDKAKVEAGVLVAQRWILARLRNRTFFSIEELNGAIAELLEDMNNRPFKKLEGCRRSAFEQVDRPAMKPLPGTRYELAQWQKKKVNIDYHLEFDHRLYSAPCALIGMHVEVRATSTVVEVFHEGHRVASHRRSYGPKGSAVTCEQHRPQSHRAYGAWPPERMVGWAETVGPHAGQVVKAMLASRPHPEAAYRSCQGLMRLSRKYGSERCEQGCKRALEIDSPRYKTVAALLERNLERGSSESESPRRLNHEGIRGAEYFDRMEGLNQSIADSTISQSNQNSNPDSSESNQSIANSATHQPNQNPDSGELNQSEREPPPSVAEMSAQLATPIESTIDPKESNCDSPAARQIELFDESDCCGDSTRLIH